MNSKLSIRFAAIALVVMVCVAVGGGQTKKDVTLHGELVDVIAFVSSPGTKQDPEVVRKSGSAGNPIALYHSNTKRLYLIGTPEVNASANARLLPYVGMRVFLVGKVYTKHGMNIILMSDIGKSIK